MKSFDIKQKMRASYLRIFIFFTFFILLLSISKFISSIFLPAEDAAILFRYSENFASTGIISYNYFGEKIEGATDFFWMIILAIFSLINLDIYFSSILLNLVSLSFIINFLKKYYNLSILEIFFIVLFKLSLSQFLASILGFSVLFVELFILLAFIFFFKKKFFLSIFFSFLGCLVRPDFILFIIPLNLYIFFFEKFKKKYLIFFTFLILGILYFFARYEYFELLFPTSFYIKSSWKILNNQEWGKEIIILAPFLFILMFVNKKDFFDKNIIIILSTAIIATFFYSSQNLIQNVGNRFYFYLPLFAILTLLELKKNNSLPEKFLIILLIICSTISVLLNLKDNYASVKYLLKSGPTYKIANQLKEINSDRKLKIAVSESGIIPYISKIETVDLYGLNTKKFIKKPASGNFVKNNEFDIIFLNTDAMGTNCLEFNFFFNKIKNENLNRNTNWTNFILNILSGINLQKYEVYFFSYPNLIFLNKNKIKYKSIKKILKSLNLQNCEVRYKIS